MQDWIYKNEKSLFAIVVSLALIFWAAILYFTMGLVLIYVLAGWLFYLFAQSGFIAWIKGNGVEVTPDQFPELYKHFEECCQKLGVDNKPRLFLMNGEGMLNALATRFLRTQYVVLFSNTVDALERKPGLVKFYIGHELGHLKRGHLTWAPLLFPVLWLPLIGAAYSRAREYTCDRHGLACADSTADACFAMAVLAAGERKWAEVKFTAYNRQVEETSGFWMSFHELCSDYPWLSKRVARMIGASKGEDGEVPSRNAFAYVFALFVPRTGLGAGGPLIIIAIIGILAAVALPAYKDYQQRVTQAQMAAQMSAFEQQDDGYGSREGGYGEAEAVAANESPAAGADQQLELALSGMKLVAPVYIDTYGANLSEAVTLERMGISESDLGQLGIRHIEFSDYAMQVTLDAINPATGDYHYLRIAPVMGDAGGMYAQCADTSLGQELLDGICS